jgi:hypothetical protein
VIIRQFFERLGRRLAAPANGPARPGLWRRLFGGSEAR